MYPEAWIATRKLTGDGENRREFRVEIAIPAEECTPPGYDLLKTGRGKDPRNVYSSKWCPTIREAKDLLFKLVGFYQSKDSHVIIYFEIRGGF